MKVIRGRLMWSIVSCFCWNSRLGNGYSLSMIGTGIQNTFIRIPQRGGGGGKMFERGLSSSLPRTTRNDGNGLQPSYYYFVTTSSKPMRTSTRMMMATTGNNGPEIDNSEDESQNSDEPNDRTPQRRISRQPYVSTSRSTMFYKNNTKSIDNTMTNRSSWVGRRSSPPPPPSVGKRSFSSSSSSSSSTTTTTSSTSSNTPTSSWKVPDVIVIPEERIELSFARSSGAGGQNVNKVNTKVELRFKVDDADWIPSEVRDRFIEQQSHRINKEGYFSLQMQEYRTQIQNRKAILNKLIEFLKEAWPRPKIRKLRQGPTKATKERNREEKKKRSETKARRQRVDF